MQDLQTQRKYNFSAGPAVLPLPVLEKVQQEMLSLPGVGSSVLEISHRSPAFDQILSACRERLTRILRIPDDFDVIFLQGGSRLQFSMVPMNLNAKGRSADYIITGSWGKKAFQEAKLQGTANCIWDGADQNYSTLPTDSELSISDDPAYVYLTSNETIQGVQFQSLPGTNSAPLVVDASSDIMSRPIDWSNIGLYYACAQKNAGVAGLTTVVIRRDLLDRSDNSLPGYLNYRNHVDEDSRYNTPPVFGIYVLGLICQWIEDEFSDIVGIESHNRAKARLLYDVIDQSDLYIGHAEKTIRSMMNVTFKLRDESFDAEFKNLAGKAGLVELGGHRSVGGFRASIYNAMPIEGVELLATVMKDFEAGL